MTYKIKLKHVLNDAEDGDFKSEKEFKEALEQFTKEDFIENELRNFRENQNEEVESKEEDLI